MTTKTAIVELLGEKAVLLPSLIADALAANDRLKLRLSVIQEAAMRVKNPTRKVHSFASEQRAAHLDGTDLDSLVTSAQLAGQDRVSARGLGALLACFASDLAAMRAPLDAAGADDAREFADRVAAAIKSLPAADGDTVSLADVEALASAAHGKSVHLLVMDLHRAINALAAGTAVETVDGAQVHSLDDRDRTLVRSFMRGLNRTAPLAFGHPGLGTTAIHAKGRLTIQNDIGTTDAHVLVIHVDATEATIMYSDNHRARTRFFGSLFHSQPISWSSPAEQTGDGLDEEPFYLVTGRRSCNDAEQLARFLEFVGSRIVFLIDWNKARKALQTFVGRSEATALLGWAAEHDFGHRAFLELGGVDLVSEIVRRTAGARIPYGAKLDESLGKTDCIEFLRQVLCETSRGLAAGSTGRLIRDGLQTDLAHRLETVESAVLAMLVRHLGLTRMLAEAIAFVLSAGSFGSQSKRREIAARAKRIEEKADRLTVSAREIAQRTSRSEKLRTMVDEIENATDSLENCTLFLSLAPEARAAATDPAPLALLSEIAVESVGHLVSAVEVASRLPQGQRADAVQSLQSLDAVVVAERSADVAERECIVAYMAVPHTDARALTLGLEIARAIETAIDHLSHAAFHLRDWVLEELSA